MEAEQPGLRAILRRGMLRRCPVCGRGRIFRSFLRLARACSECGWVLEREPGTVTGAMYVIAVFTQFFAVALWLLLWWLTDWEPWLKLVVATPVLVGFSLLMLPVSKGLWIAVEYYTDIASGETERADYREKAFGEP